MMNISAAMNMKARRKATPNTTQGWLPLANNNQFRKITFDSYHSHLISIAKAIHDANEEFLAIVGEYLRWRTWSNARNAFSFNSQKQGRFTDDDLTILKDLVQAGPPVGKFSVPQLLERLRQTSYINIWKRAAENMAYLKNHPKHQTRKHLESARKRAEKIKECRTTVEASYAKVENELRNQMLFGVCDGILEKVAMLRKYEEAYPVLPESGVPKVRLNFPVSILLCCVSVYLIVCLIPMVLAFKKSSNTPGSTKDSDFWWFIQASMMQIPGSLMSVCNISQKSTEKSTAWTCALCLTTFGIMCTIASIPTYLYLSTMWGNFIAFGAEVAQVIVMLELTLITYHPKIKQS